MDAGCDSTGTTTEAETEETGVSMGSDVSVVCELTGLLIDAESTDLTPLNTSERCPQRVARYHCVDRGPGADRLSWAHEAVEAMWALVHRQSAKDGDAQLSERNLQLLKLIDPHRKDWANPECWVIDKQGFYWLQQFVHYKSPGADPLTARNGRNTPASLLMRACDAYAARLALGVPNFATMPAKVRDGSLSRETEVDLLPNTAGVKVVHRDDFLWLTYGDLGMLVQRVAVGLRRLGLPEGAYVAISGYNDFEFAIADFAVAVAGMVSVPIHGTYTSAAAAAVVNKVRCVGVCFMRDHANVAARKANGGKWSIQDLVAHCPSLQHAVVMDAVVADLNDVESSSQRVKFGSFLDFVRLGVDAPKDGELPDPFAAQGAPYVSVVPDKSQSAQRVTTILFTSGSSGTPKAVAVGVNEFVTDISFPSPGSGVTVSYIPLSHGSDRYKVWAHVVFGARVGFCQFGAENWEWREINKETAPGLSAVDLLFEQVRRLKPTSMACPPNIWAGLHQICRQNDMATVRKLLGPKMKSMVTGGAPTPASDAAFARRLSRQFQIAFSDSYGTTESGGITANGYQTFPRYVLCVEFCEVLCDHSQGFVFTYCRRRCCGMCQGMKTLKSS